MQTKLCRAERCLPLQTDWLGARVELSQAQSHGGGWSTGATGKDPAGLEGGLSISSWGTQHRPCQLEGLGVLG